VNALKLGVIGMSEGNGHPYSWSAILNGYDPFEMEHCGFPDIPRYLALQKFPQDLLVGADVTHIWTQDYSRSHHISKASKINCIVRNPEEMIGLVDGVLLARDDAENHLHYAKPFLDAGIPIYIDKPLALSASNAKKLFDLQKYPGQIFTCSALRYAPELQLCSQEHKKIGNIKYIQAISPKDWERYAVHLIEPILMLIPNRGRLVDRRLSRMGNVVTLDLIYQDAIHVQITTLGSCASPIGFRVIGDLGFKDLIFIDPFGAFKTALIEFIASITTRKPRIPQEFVIEVSSIIEAGLKI